MYRSMTKFKKDWVKALRSGKYKQTEGNLCTAGDKYDSFCCLGVAANILIEAGNELEWSDKADFAGHLTLHNIKTDNVECGTLYDVAPEWMKKWLSQYESEVISMNDYGHSFKSIAYYIEKTK